MESGRFALFNYGSAEIYFTSNAIYIGLWDKEKK